MQVKLRGCTYIQVRYNARRLRYHIYYQYYNAYDIMQFVKISTNCSCSWYMYDIIIMACSRVILRTILYYYDDMSKRIGGYQLPGFSNTRDVREPVIIICSRCVNNTLPYRHFISTRPIQDVPIPISNNNNRRTILYYNIAPSLY